MKSLAVFGRLPQNQKMARREEGVQIGNSTIRILLAATIDGDFGQGLKKDRLQQFTEKSFPERIFIVSFSLFGQLFRKVALAVTLQLGPFFVLTERIGDVVVVGYILCNGP